MTAPLPPIDKGILTGVLATWLETQPWYKRSANTVTGFILGGLALAWLLATVFTSMPEWLDVLIGAVLFLSTVIGLKLTPNGMTPGLAEQTVDRVDSLPPPVVEGTVFE